MTNKDFCPPSFLSKNFSDRLQFLREKELAERWRLDVKTLQRWRYIHKGPDYIKLHGRVIYPLQSIIDFEQIHLKKMGVLAEQDL